MISRREWLGRSLRAGAAMALTPELLRAHQTSGGKLLQRAIPSSGEMLPVIGLGARRVDLVPLKEVLKALVDNGGRVVDTLHGGPLGEQGAGTAANELGIQKEIFWTTPLSVAIPLLPGHAGPPPKADPAAVKAQIEEKFATFKASKIDLAQVLLSGDCQGTGSLTRLRNTYFYESIRGFRDQVQGRVSDSSPP